MSPAAATGRLALAVVVALLAVPPARAAEDLDTLRRRLVDARRPEQVRFVLDVVCEAVGTVDGLPDHGALGDWLGRLPPATARQPAVLERRGWAYVRAKRGAEAIALLERALEVEPENGFVHAYLGEAYRQAGRHADALAALTRAARRGERGAHVTESATEAALALRRSGEAARAAGLPAYARGLGAFLAAAPAPLLDATLAQWLLEDLDAYDRPGTERGTTWARTAAAHALRAVRRAPEPIAGGARMAYDAAVALGPADRAARGATARFDLLAWACRLGDAESLDAPHPLPKAFVLLGEAARDEGRFALAHRMARRRLAISWSPRARRLLDTLPPDLGAE